MPKLNILIVDDEANIRKTLTAFLESRDHSVHCAGSYESALIEAGLRRFDLALVDLRLGTESGLDLVPALAKSSPWMNIVVITAYASVDTAVLAMKRGASDYITKPFNPSRLEQVLEQTAERCETEKRAALLRHHPDELQSEPPLVSRDPAMQRTIELAAQVAATEAVVLLQGQSGTGKTMIARIIHDLSPRANKPFRVISSPSLSPELLESELFGHAKGSFTGAMRDNPGKVAACEGGTLFLDEIGELPLSIQPKLLRFIQEREYERIGEQSTRKADVRIIAATNGNLRQAVGEGRFREDLFYRLNVVQIDLPSLAERPSDIVPLAENLLSFFNARNNRTVSGFSDEVLNIFRKYPWPGNIRELRNVIERAVILGHANEIDIELLPETMLSTTTLTRLGDPVSLDKIEEQHIRKVIADSSSLQEAAEILGIDQATLWRKRKQLGIR
ncbi:MAG: sigma-54-dependent Fis family transcriptional regulator [Chlorobiaceae bacterium]|nr:sigma-54-dependent Fis family transcriptional regulator [Chlorobiaceae bacterium]